MSMRNQWKTGLWHGARLAASAALIGAPGYGIGCGDTATSGTSADSAGAFAAPTASGGVVNTGSVGLSQGGAQDFGLFRKILEEGGLPGPDTIDDLGFFAEHKLDFPEAECGQDVCVHASLGMMGNMISGGDCTLVQIGLNTPLDPAEMERPPIHMVLALDVSGSMQGEPLAYVKSGLLRMLDHVAPEDTISLVTYASEAEVVLEAVPATEMSTLAAAFDGLSAEGTTNIYGGLVEAFAVAEAHLDPTRQNRVVLLSDGQATAGLTVPEKMANLAADHAKSGIGLTSIGLGEDFDASLMGSLAEVGAGNFYFLDDASAVVEVFSEEVKTFMVPVATDVRIDLEVGEDYVLGAVYGTHGFAATAAGGVIEIPALFIAGRTDASAPIEEGRRGGGGAILIELIPVGDGPVEGEPEVIIDVAATWSDPLDGAGLGQLVPITDADTPSSIPLDGYFTDFTVEKAFVMLNLLVGFEMAAELVEDGDLPGARGLLTAVGGAVEGWVAENPDPDIEDDLTYVDLFIDNVAEAEAQLGINVPPPQVQPDPWPGGD